MYLYFGNGFDFSRYRIKFCNNQKQAITHSLNFVYAILLHILYIFSRYQNAMLCLYK